MNRLNTPMVIFETYSGGTLGILANVVVGGIVAILLVLMAQAVYTRRASGRW